MLLRIGLGLGLAVAAFGADLLNGNWSFSMAGPGGQNIDAKMTLSETDGKFTGSVEFPGARVLKITEGAVDGKKITFVVKRDRQDGGSMTYKMSGEVDGAKIKGAAETEMGGQMQKIDWSATKQ
ncbi:MAG: hypothetical protein ACK58M_25350 [Acidobacteriota bacterium]|jgi:hypothetical protein|nr:hypothetical protein [Bryobacteraceae bacterium CoA2 C42]MCA2965261.1 hypothetical protein [Acidobacteriaceae bacterium]